MYIMDIIFNIRKQQKIMSRTKMLSVNPWISRELQDRNVYFKRCTVGEVYSIWYKYLFYRKVFFSKRSFLAFHRFNIKTWLKWCTFDAPPSDLSVVTLSAFSEPFPKAISWNYLHLSLHKPLEKVLIAIAWTAYSKFNPRDHFYSKQNAY